MADGLQQIPLDKIQPSKTNPRKTFSKDALAELAASIKAKGVLQPILVRPLGGLVGPDTRIYNLAIGDGNPDAVAAANKLEKLGVSTLGELGERMDRETTSARHNRAYAVIRGATGVSAAEAKALCRIVEGQEDGKTGEGFELVAGERRLRAAKLAGLTEIPAIVSSLTDREVLEIQVIENEQRADLSPLEKAKGYQALLAEDYTIEDLATKIGKAETTIRALLKLLGAPKTVQKAVEDGTLPMSTAELIARVPNAKLREECGKDVLEGLDTFDGTPMSYRQAKDHISREYMIELKQAPFSKERADLLPSAGACTSCPKLAGNNRDEYPDARADMCMDPECYREKVKAHEAATLKLTKDSGKKILTAKETKGLFYSYGDPPKLTHDAPYVDLAGMCNEWNGSKPINKGWKSLVGKQLAGDVVVAVDPKGGVHELVPKAKAMAILKKDHGVKDGRMSGGDARWKKQQAEERRKGEIGKRAAAAALGVVNAKACSTFGLIVGWGQATPGLLRGLIGILTMHSWYDAARLVAKRRGIDTGKDTDVREELIKLADSYAFCPQLLGLLSELIAARMIASWGSPHHDGGAEPDEKAFYKAWGIDPGKLKKEAATSKPKSARCEQQRCRECGCTEDDCAPCIAVTGEPCHWVEPDLCSRCVPEKNGKVTNGNARPSLKKAAQATLPSLEDTLEQESDDDALDEGLRLILERYQGGKARWAEIAEQGASDDELREAIDGAFGLSGSVSMKDGTPIIYVGGADPAIWFDNLNRHGKATLAGKALLARVRGLYSIPKSKKKKVVKA